MNSGAFRVAPLAGSPSRPQRLQGLAWALTALLGTACHRDAMPDVGDSPVPANSAPAATPATVPTAPASASVPDDAPPETRTWVLAVGQSADVAADTRLRFERVASDSRCPKNAQCVWAGDVRIALALLRAGGRVDFEIGMAMDQVATLDGFRVELLDFDACPKDSAAPTGSECATLGVQTEPLGVETEPATANTTVAASKAGG